MELWGQLFSCLFCATLLPVIPFSERHEVISSPIVTGIVGQDVVLPCHIFTGTQPANMEVHWKKIIPAHEEIVHEYRAQIGQDVPGQKYQGRTELLKGGFTSGNVSLKLKNVQPSDGGTYICTVKSEEWNAEAVIELRIAELKNGETLKEKEKRERRRAFTPETFENSTEKMVVDNLARQIKILIGTVVLICIILIGIIFFICCCLKKKSEDPEKGRLISGEEDSKKWKPDRVQEVEEMSETIDEIPEIVDSVKGKDYIAELQTLRSQVDELQIKLGGKEKHNEEELQTLRSQVELQTLRSQVDKLQIKVDWTWTLIHSDNITLNPYTAHPNLSISEDKKKFTHEPQPQKVPSSPERFDSTVCVLGSEGFSFGKQCWEVDVRSSTDWDLGVARKATERKGKLSLSAKEGFWVLGLSGRDYWAKTDPWTRIMVQKKPLKIGVYLSYQEERVTFFNVTDMSVLFTFNDCSFSGEVCPFFKNSHKETTMRICSIGGDK